MKREEFLRERADLVIGDIIDNWGIQRNKDGTCFIYTPMDKLDDFIDIFDHDIEEGIAIYDEDEFDDEDSPFPEDVYKECLEEISNTFNEIAKAREPYEDDFDDIIKENEKNEIRN